MAVVRAVDGEYGLYHGAAHGVRDAPGAPGVRGVPVGFQGLVRYGE